MRSSDDTPINANKALLNNKEHSLFFFETVNGRSYMRLTRLAVILIVGLTVVSIISILLIFLFSSQPSTSKPVNVNVSVPSPSPYVPKKPILRPPPPQPQPPKVAQPVYSMPTPSNTPLLYKNYNGQAIPKLNPQSPPSESPP